MKKTKIQIILVGVFLFLISSLHSQEMKDSELNLTKSEFKNDSSSTDVNKEEIKIKQDEENVVNTNAIIDKNLKINMEKNHIASFSIKVAQSIEPELGSQDIAHNLVYVIDLLFLALVILILILSLLTINQLFKSVKLRQTRKGVEFLAFTIKDQENRIQNLEARHGGSL